ncbi:MAG: AAA family ATPase [Spirochaetota bacterium]
MVYVDKSRWVYQMAALPGRYFLSRPRRFGKSLMVDTFKSLFEGKKELFKGLYIYDMWNWDKSYPVIKLDFVTSGARNREELDIRIAYMLRSNAERLGVSIAKDTDIPGQFADLIKKLVQKTDSKAVVLVDEYDKPLLDNLERPEVLEELRDRLRSLYSVIKDQDENLRFVFLTGVSKFSKVNIFSGINNLKDITLSKDYGSLCGYTEQELHDYFKEHLAGVNWEDLRRWYNGYNYLGEPVYNPFDILLFLSEHHTYRNYWFETGTPTFLIKLFQENRYFLPDLEALEVGEELLSIFDINTIDPVTLLFQTGYLTIKQAKQQFGKHYYSLQFPNYEVRTSFNEFLISGYTAISQEKVYYER